MTCSYCGTRIGEGETRCRLCGRKPGDTLTGEFTLTRTQGALATQPRPAIQIRETRQPNSKPTPVMANAVQTSLFQERSAAKVVPIRNHAPVVSRTVEPRTVESRTVEPKIVEPRIVEAKIRTPRTQAPKPAQRRASRIVEGQGTLDFLPSETAKPRTLGTAVEAVIVCEAPAATPLHRAVAAALDISMVLIGYGLFLVTYGLMGGQFALNRANLGVFGGALALVAVTYGLVWTIANTETAGMHWMHLRLTTFEGFTPEPKQRIMRFLGSCLSTCTVLGLLWCLVDEESLTWQDHMSSTFPTPRAAEAQVFRKV
jgi:uncharacterized RDD family membrane protein YckC